MAIRFKDIEMPMQEALWHAVNATNEHKALQQEYATMNNEINSLQGLLDQQDPNSEAYKNTLNMINNIKQEAQNLANNGIGVSNRNNLYNLQGQYQRTVVPIKNAYESRYKTLEAQNAAIAKDPSLIYEGGGAQGTSIDDWVKNPNMQFKQYSGAQLTKEVSTAAANLAGKFINGQNALELKSLVGGDYYAFIERRGFSPEAIQQAIMESPKASPILQGIVENAMQASGIRTWADKEQLAMMEDRARQGLYSAMGKDDANLTPNWRRQMEAKMAAARKAQEEAAQDNFRYREVDQIIGRENAEEVKAVFEKASDLTPDFFALPSSDPSEATSYWDTFIGPQMTVTSATTGQPSNRYDQVIENRKNFKHLSDKEKAILKQYGVENYDDLFEKGFYTKDDQGNVTRAADFGEKMQENMVQRTSNIVVGTTDIEEIGKEVLKVAQNGNTGSLYELRSDGTYPIEYGDGIGDSDISIDSEVNQFYIPSFEQMRVGSGNDKVFQPMVVLNLANGRDIGVAAGAINTNLQNVMNYFYRAYVNAKASNNQYAMKQAQVEAARAAYREITYNKNHVMGKTGKEIF